MDTYFFPEKPKLLNINQPLFEKLSNDPNWVAEPKYNGSRLILVVNGTDIQFWNRHGEQFNYKPNDGLQSALLDLASQTKGYCRFDSELRHNKVPGVRDKIVLWDCFVWNGELLVDMPYIIRQNYLPWPTLTKHFEHYAPIEQHIVNFDYLFHDWIKDPEIEGLVIKNLQGKLNLSRTAGQNSNWMFKVRRPNNSYRF